MGQETYLSMNIGTYYFWNYLAVVSLFLILGICVVRVLVSKNQTNMYEIAISALVFVASFGQMGFLGILADNAVKGLEIYFPLGWIFWFASCLGLIFQVAVYFRRKSSKKIDSTL